MRVFDPSVPIPHYLLHQNQVACRRKLTTMYGKSPKVERLTENYLINQQEFQRTECDMTTLWKIPSAYLILVICIPNTTLFL